MTTHRITLLAGWYQVVESSADGTAVAIGSFRTEADARDWLKIYLRMQTGGEVFKVGYSEVQALTSAKSKPAEPVAKATVGSSESG
jgi:hypothetical protein